MKATKSLSVALLLAAALTPAVQLQAQTSKDNIVASPKFRQILDERKTVPHTVSSSLTAADGRFVSPKLREQLDSQAKIARAANSVDLAHPGNNRVVKPPKFRDQSGALAQIAPIK